MVVFLGYLDADVLMVVLVCAVDLAVALVDMLGDVQGEGMAARAQALACSDNLDGAVALGASPRVSFKVVEGPGLGGSELSCL